MLPFARARRLVAPLAFANGLGPKGRRAARVGRAAALAACVAALPLLASAPAPAPARAAEPPLFERDVLPILTKNCLGCHGGLRQFGGLDLRTLPAMLAGGESGPAIESGRSDQSELWRRVVSDEMPEGKEREKLSSADKAVLKDWIDARLPTVAERVGEVDPLLPPGQRHEPKEVAAAIDEHLDRFLAAAKLAPAAPSDDAEFLRRVCLDITGRVPTPETAAEFLDSDDPDKRAKLIDALLDTPQFGEQFGRVWRDWICPPELPSDDNGGEQPHRQANALGQWIGEKVVKNEPWDRVTREILTAHGEIKNSPQLIFFGLVGQGGKITPDGSARAAASLFLGVRLQCAECHDDPYRDWSQKQHWSLAAFFGRSQGDFNKIEVGKGPSKKSGEIVIPNTAFKNAGSNVPAAFLTGAAYEPRGDDDPRAALADWLTARDNPWFAPAFANRLWFYFFARGIVNPIDDMRPLNPPSHPGLLKLLANEFADSGHDVKHLARCLTLSRAYQRSSQSPPSADEQTTAALTAAFGRMPLRVLTADMLLDSLKLAYGETKEFDLRSAGKDNTTGQAATVGDAYREFHRKFGTNEEDAADFTHGVSQMLTLINHPRLLAGGKGWTDYLKANPAAEPGQVIERMYLATLSRRPDADEAAEALRFVSAAAERAAGDRTAGYNGVLWMLVNRGEFLLQR